MAVTLFITASIACATYPEQRPQETLEQTALSRQPAPLCPQGDDGGHRVNDLAEHVYDTAVASYLAENASGIGREVKPDSRAYAMALIATDEHYWNCVTRPEQCLRAELAKAVDNEGRDAILSSKGDYAYKRAAACLQRAGDAYAAGEPVTPPQQAEFEAIYRQRILPHLVGNVMPLATLIDSNFYGRNNEDAYKIAQEVWDSCYETMASRPVDPDNIVDQISKDITDPFDCADEWHRQMLVR